MEACSRAGRAELRCEEYLYGYGVKDETVVYLKKHQNGIWDDSWYWDGADIVFKYQNCFGSVWENKVKPALLNTPSDALIVVQVFPPERYFHVTKRDISPHGRGFSTFTVIHHFESAR